MIPGPFVYHRPQTLGDASKLLAQYGDEARILAGGHSLIPMMKLRMAVPEHVVDIGAIGDLKGIKRIGDTISIGSMTTQAELVASDVISGSVPLVREASLLIADPQVRYVGTVGGNVANGDPGNDMPAVMMALNAVYRLTKGEAARSVAAREFYLGAYATALGDGEILTSIEIPAPSAGHGFAYEKLKRKIGDYATAAVAVILNVSGGRVSNCAIALTNLGETAIYCDEASRAANGSALDTATTTKVADLAARLMSPADDARGPPEYRVSVGKSLIKRALQRAYARSGGRA